MKLRAIRITPATSTYMKEAIDIEQRLKNADIYAEQRLGRTTKGTRCIRVLVDDAQYTNALKLAHDLLPAPFKT